MITFCHSNAADREPVRGGARKGAWAATDSVSEWIVEIRKVWTLGASSTIELARVVSTAKTRLRRHYGQWSRLWMSEQKMPVSKSTADQLAVIGQRMGGLDSQTSENLPRGWNILYCLARLDSQTLEHLIQQGFVHPKLTLREAKELVGGKPTEARTRKANARGRLRRFEEFVRNTVHDWEIQEREFAAETLTQLIEQIGAAETTVFKPTRNSSAFITEPGLLTDQRIKL